MPYRLPTNSPKTICSSSVWTLKLLAPAQGRGKLVLTLGQDGKDVVDPAQRGASLTPRPRLKRPDFEVLEHAHPAEQSTPLRHEHDASLDDPMSSKGVDRICI